MVASHGVSIIAEVVVTERGALFRGGRDAPRMVRYLDRC